MSDKVKLRKNVAEVLEKLRSGTVDSEIVFDHAQDGSKWVNYKELNELSLDTLIRALYIGYEVEETPEDKLIRQYFLPVGFLNEDDTTVTIYRKGIEFALDTFNIKIEGVNA